jgi:hypothetical protein
MNARHFHELSRQLVEEALMARSYATSGDTDAVWKHTRRTMRKASALLSYLETDTESHGHPHKTTPTPADSHEITHTGGN